MAFSIKKFNKNGNKFDVNTQGLSYHSLKAIWEDEKNNGVDPGTPVHVFCAAFINTKSRYGENANLVVVTPDENGEIVPAYIASLPAHLTDTVKEMLADTEAVDAIKNYQVGFSIREYHNKKFNVDAYTVDWCDVE